MSDHSTDFFDLKGNLQGYLDTINDEIAALEVKKTVLQNAIVLAQTCGDHCICNNIGE